MVKLPDEFKDNVKKIIEEILESDLSTNKIEELSSKWVECVKEILEYNKISYSEKDLEEVKNSFLKSLDSIRKHKNSAESVEENI